MKRPDGADSADEHPWLQYPLLILFGLLALLGMLVVGLLFLALSVAVRWVLTQFVGPRIGAEIIGLFFILIGLVGFTPIYRRLRGRPDVPGTRPLLAITIGVVLMVFGVVLLLWQPSQAF